MSTRRQIVTRYQPPAQPGFDQQYWPIAMATAITAAILAATIVTLLTGFWMWVSLMVLPAAAGGLLITLRFVDNRVLRRSLQLAIIVSLALHCLFLIFARQTDIFSGLFVESTQQTTPDRKPRVIHVARETSQRRWTESVETPTPTSDVDVPERETTENASTASKQPVPVTRTEPTNNPELVRKETPAETLPRLSKSPAQLNRQSENVQPRSSESLNASQPAPRSATAVADRPSPSATSVPKSAAASPDGQPQRRRRESNDSPAASPSRIARAEPAESSPSKAPPTPREPTSQPTPATRPTTAQPTVADVPAPAPGRNARAQASQRQQPAATDLAQAPERPSAERTPMETPRPRTQPTEMANRRPTTHSESQPTVDNRMAEVNPRQATDRANRRTSPTVVESPAPLSTPSPARTEAAMQPAQTAISKAQSGAAGIGRSSNVDREVGSTQSTAPTPANSMNRRERSSANPEAPSLTSQQASEAPRSAANAPLPSSTLSPDTLFIASRAAADRPSESTASASASLSQSDSDAARSEVSVEKGTGSIDNGSTRIVTDVVSQRVEGGGQPEPSSQLAQMPTERIRGGSTPAPSVADAGPDNSVADTTPNSAASRIADRPSAEAAAAETAVADRQQNDDPSGERATQPSANRDVALNETGLGPSRANAANGEEDDEEEQRRLMEALAGQRESVTAAPGRASPQVAESGPATNDDRAALSNGDGPPAERIAGASELADADAIRAQSGQSESERSGTTGNDGELASRVRPRSREIGRPASQPGQGDQPEGIAANISPDTGRRGDSGGGPVVVDDAPDVSGEVARATGRAPNQTAASELAEMDRDTPPGMALEIDRQQGPAGIGEEAEPDVGMDSRRASRDSQSLQATSDNRFRRPDAGGVPNVNEAPTVAAEAFRSRETRTAPPSGPRTEEAIELGLAFLARYQQEDGSWTLGGFEVDRNQQAKMLSSDTAATGLALLAFQGAGYHHREFRYAARLQRAIDWLIENQRDTGELYVDSDESSNQFTRLYSHGIATLALTEAYGMTGDERLRGPAQKALDYIAASQDRRLGGWRYRAGQGSDTSVTGWMVMALQSGRLAGLQTDNRAFGNASRWLDSAEDAQLEHLFRYNPTANDSDGIVRSHGRVPTPCMSAVGLLMRLYVDWDKGDARLAAGAEYLLENLPDDSTMETRDTYYWYYATQVLRHQGGEIWSEWYNALHPLLLQTQERSGALAGSWDPLQPVPDRWGAHGGRLYVTTMNLLSLEVDYRLLPLYEKSTPAQTRGE